MKPNIYYAYEAKGTIQYLDIRTNSHALYPSVAHIGLHQRGSNAVGL